jgi:hypothetical protein
MLHADSSAATVGDGLFGCVSGSYLNNAKNDRVLGMVEMLLKANSKGARQSGDFYGSEIEDGLRFCEACCLNCVSAELYIAILKVVFAQAERDGWDCREGWSEGGPVEFAACRSSGEVLEFLLDRWPDTDAVAQENGWDSLLSMAVTGGDRYDDDGTKAVSRVRYLVCSASWDGSAEGL